MGEADGTTGVLLMAVGGPASLDDVEGFLKDIRRGRPTPPALVEEFRLRYARIGGRSPLLEITESQAQALEDRLAAPGSDFRVFVGMRHWRPYIRDTLREISRAGIRRIVALCLTPYYSKMSVGAYFQAVEDGLASQRLRIEVAYVDSWNDDPALVEAYAGKVRAALARLAREGLDDPVVLLTAHSLPSGIIADGDPYEAELKETMGLILDRLPRVRALLCYQSAGRSEEPWLGPSLEEVLDGLGEAGERGILVAPFGFVSDHVEILYDIDIDAKARADRWGLRLERAESLNTDPGFIEAMARTVLSRARGQIRPEPSGGGRSGSTDRNR